MKRNILSLLELVLPRLLFSLFILTLRVLFIYEYFFTGFHKKSLNFHSTISAWPRSEAELNERTLFVIRLSASTSVIGVFFLFTVIWCCLRRHNITLIDLPTILVKYDDQYDDEDNNNNNNNNNNRNGKLHCPLPSDYAEHCVMNGLDIIDDTDGLISKKHRICHTCCKYTTSLSKNSESSDIYTNSNDSEDFSNFKNNHTPVIIEASDVIDDRNFNNKDVGNESESPSESSPHHRYLDLPASLEEQDGLTTEPQTEINNNFSQTPIKDESIIHDQNPDIVELVSIREDTEDMQMTEETEHRSFIIDPPDDQSLINRYSIINTTHTEINGGDVNHVAKDNVVANNKK